ncbi:Mitochondrial ribosome small subunit component, mediator of apoptosis DAP3 [Phaffia rhodozyma]|uniref:Small ribosomal subunit protein mS29 n=1 Tax=Phaffia rhodozyma TaxID=264483 RepID=A0A0F7SUV8_PHARH|nr:Mitochondrial ribosome small subunit component, mediator of apoptosis DAP3 [Phaffia rhodozyma]
MACLTTSLARIARTSPSTVSAVRLLSTTPACYLPPKKAAAAVRTQGPKRAIVQKKGGPVKPGRRGGWGSFSFNRDNIPGIEEEADLSGIPEFSPSVLSPDAVGQLHQYDRSFLQSITQVWGRPTGGENAVFPLTVPRKLTLDLATRLDANKTDGFADQKILLNGGSGCGKSVLMFQTVAHAMQTGWLVMYIPRGFIHVNSKYAFHHSSKTQTFHQPSLSASLLESFIKSQSNHELLSRISLVKDHVFTPDLPAGTGTKTDTEVTLGAVAMEHEVKGNAGKSGKKAQQEGRRRTLVDLCKLGVDNLGVSVQVLETVIEILSKQKEIPFLFALDCAQAYFGASEYKTPENHRLESYHLSVPRLFLDYISGRKDFTSGTFLLSLSASQTDSPITRSLLAGLSLHTEQQPLKSQSGKFGGSFSPSYYPPSSSDGEQGGLKKWHVEHAKELKVLDVPDGMTVGEAKGLWEVKVVKKSLHMVNSDEHFLTKYVEAGGNPREFFRGINYTTQ